MDTLEELLASDPLGGAERERRKRVIRQRLGCLSRESDSPLLLGALARFCEQRPWTFWSNDAVGHAQSVLETNAPQTQVAFNARHHELERAFAELLRPVPAATSDQSLSESRALDLISLATEFNPAYLHYAEHVLGNLLALYWTALKPGRERKRYVLKNAVDQLRASGREALCAGYVDEQRNAIAHGKVVFTAFGIRYGEARPKSALDVLYEFDQLIRTCNALAVGVVLFLARDQTRWSNVDVLPPSLLALFAASATDRQGFDVLGAVESETDIAGRQLHVAFRTEFLSRSVALFDAARLAYALVRNGAAGYDRIVFEVIQKRPVASLIPVSPRKLRRLLQEAAPINAIADIFQQPATLWYDESGLSRRLRSLRQILRSRWRLVRMEVVEKWHDLGLARARGKWAVREVERVSAGWYSGIKVHVVLSCPEDGSNRALLRDIIAAAARRHRYVWVPFDTARFRALRFPVLPRYVVVNIYRYDGSMRWIGRDGWLGGNLLAVGELSLAIGKPHRLVTNPQDIYKKVRIRYEIDAAYAADAVVKAHEFVKNFRTEALRRRANELSGDADQDGGPHAETK